jgi:dTDP-4-dehydrorhamnose 3,5-epimerase
MPFEFERLAVADIVLVRPRAFGDARGFFLESYRKSEFERAGIRGEFVQDNHVRTAQRGVLRGLHFQRDPHAQAKLVRCVRGRVFDAALDLRRESPTFGKSACVELSEADRAMLYVPRGFAHGYVTLTDDSEVLYKVDAEYAPAAEGGVLWSDPDLAIPWPVGDPILNDRDRAWPRLRDLR